MLKRLNLAIKMSELHEQHVTVYSWELPIVRAMHGNKVTVLGETTINREAPDAQEEFGRLQRRYGKTNPEDGGKGAPYVDAVYGQFGVGTAALAKAIDEAVIEEIPDAPLAGVGGQASAEALI